MKLLKVSVPNFRNLQNVELTFEPDLSPAVFPIASQNGGGKSTLLQLIFILFHCAISPDKYKYITNFFDARNKLKGNKVHNVANFDFEYKNKIISISFNILNFNSISLPKSFANKLTEILFDENYLRKDISKSLLTTKTDLSEADYANFRKKEHNIQLEIERLQREIYDKNKALDENLRLKAKINKEQKFLLSLLMDFDFEKEKTSEHCQILYCSIDNDIEYDFAAEGFSSISKSIFLAAPSTQPFLFLDKSSKKEMFNDLSKYCKILVSKKEELPNFYLYSQLTVSELIETFKKARNRDWQEAINSNNLSYGSKFKQLVDDFHNFLGHDKYILPTSELDSIVVKKQISETERIELEPEDLSHGELRRLGLYAWIKYNIPENSIILIDEVENAMHPDWQYNIADELASWGNNQYLLATHSFHLCEALTPKHVKEIEPKMSKPDSEAAD